MKRIKGMAITVLMTLFLAPSTMAQDQDIVDTAIAAGSFSTLVTAVQVAGLEDALRGDGPFTVFAPTDDAFAAVPADTLQFLLDNPDELANVLLYHVVAGEVFAADVVNLTSAETLQGESVAISVTDGNVMVNQANVIATDVQASNGVIHVIDAVLLPPAPLPDIVDTAIAAGSFNTLVAAVQAAGLEDALRSEGPFTVFAPTDDAFAQIPADTLNALLADPAALGDILLYHVVSGASFASDVLSRPGFRMLNGEFTTITANDQGAFINESRIIATDIETSNGVIHVIDQVLIPSQPGGITYTVTITNNTKGQTFTPPLVVTHRPDISLFAIGQPASDGLATLAEDGDVTPLATALGDNDLVYDISAGDGLIGPGETVTLEVTAAGTFRQVSVAAMLIPTNDTFVAAEVTLPLIDGIIKSGVGSFKSVTTHALAYDAGSEFNSENCSDIPGPLCGSSGVSPAEEGEGFVHIANGIHGIGDLASSTYDWRGPVATITVTRQ